MFGLARCRVRETIALVAALMVADAFAVHAQSADADDQSRKTARPCAVASPECRGQLTVAGQSHVYYFRTFALEQENPSVRRAILVIPGGQRMPERYFKALVDAARTAGTLDETLIVAPGFKIGEDTLAPGELWWDRDGGWKQGDPSTEKLPVQVSSYEVADRLITQMADRRRFPNMREVVVTGHSSGGQFTQRYAAATRIESSLTNVQMRFVVANPSSYLYLSADRPKLDAPGQFLVPPDPGCSYNDYKHGLERRNEYMNRVAAGQLVDQYRARHVIYLLGTADTDPNHDGLDRSCAGMLQGRFRYERGIAFKAYLDMFFSPHNHRLLTVPGVGHEGEKMFGSAAGRSALFPDAKAGSFSGR